MASPGIPPNLWRRWDHPDAGIHEYCPLAYSGDESEDHPCSDTAGSPIEYLSGIPRRALRHTPLVTFLAIAYLYVWSLYRLSRLEGFQVDAIGNAPIGFANSTLPVGSLLLGGLGVVLAGTAIVIGYYSVVGRPVPTVLRLSVISLLFTILAAGTGVSSYGLYFGFPAAIPDGLARLLIKTGYTLTLFVGGLFVYDGMLRTETLFCKLDETEVLRNPSEYEGLRAALADDLTVGIATFGRGNERHGDVDPIRAIVGLVLIVLIAIFVLITDWSGFGRFGPLDAAFDIGWWVFLNLSRLLIILVAYKFVVLVTFIRVLSVEGTTQSVTLLYHPFHPDGLGGFRDIGKFATRVNVLIILGGVYLLYFSLDNVGALGGLPWIVYSLVVILWFRYSFVALHERMRLDKQEWLRAGGPPDGIEPIGGFAEQATIADVRNSPEWPVSATQLTRLISVNAAPIVRWLLKVWLQPA